MTVLIDVDGRRASLERDWNRAQVQKALLHNVLSLTKVDSAPGQETSVTHSLATCLIQHASGNYKEFSNLGEAWKSFNSLKKRPHTKSINCGV